MCAKLQSNMTVQTLRKGIDRNPSSAPQMLSSHDAIGILGINIVINSVVILTLAHSPSSPTCRIDHLSKAPTVPATSLRGQIAQVASKAKALVNGSRAIAFYAVSLVTGCLSVLLVAGCRLYLRNRLKPATSKKTEGWAVCCHM